MLRLNKTFCDLTTGFMDEYKGFRQNLKLLKPIEPLIFLRDVLMVM